MLKVPQASIWGNLKEYLSARQDEINALADYPAMVKRAESSWDNKSAKAFEHLRGLLADLCQGACRCNYCEDSVAELLKFNMLPNMQVLLIIGKNGLEKRKV